MKHLKILLIALLFSTMAMAQDSGSFSLNLYGGYNFEDKIEYNNSYAQIGDGFQYGAGFEYFVDGDNSVELKYLRIDTDMPIYALGVQLNKGDDKGAFNYILVEGTHYFVTGPKFHPFLGGGLGLGISEVPQNGSDTHFAWDIRGGVKIKTSSTVSVNLHAYLQSMSAAVGNSYYYTYYGVVGVTDYVATYEFGLGAVLCFKFKG
jgi:hypothetical protein